MKAAEQDLSALLLGTLGYTPDEFVSIGHEADGRFHTAVGSPTGAATFVATLPEGASIFFGVNPVRGPRRKNAGRGTAEDVTRLAALWADLDVKRGACRNLSTAHIIIDELSNIIGQRPSAITHSGNGLHPYWPISDGQASQDVLGALLKRWGRLVAVVAENHGARADSVFDLPRMLRVPGTVNPKTNGHKIRVTTFADTGGPLTVAEIDERLNEHGVYQEDDDTADTADTAEVSPPEDWQFGQETCFYVAPIINDIPGDGPITGKGRHPWVLKQAVRFACAYLLGCISEADWRAAQKLLDTRLCELRAATGEKAPKYEVPAAFRWAVKKAATKTAEAARGELGAHSHGEGAKSASSDRRADHTDVAPVPLAKALLVFRRWLHIEDTGPVLVVAAAVVANLADGDPVWVLIVGPPSSGKTEILQSISGLRRPVVTLRRQRQLGRAALRRR